MCSRVRVSQGHSFGVHQGSKFCEGHPTPKVQESSGAIPPAPSLWPQLVPKGLRARLGLGLGSDLARGAKGAQNLLPRHECHRRGCAAVSAPPSSAAPPP